MKHNFSDWNGIYYFIKESFNETKKYQKADFINFLETVFDTGFNIGFSEGDETGRNFGYNSGLKDMGMVLKMVRIY